MNARIKAGLCRHCGGAVPCWSPYGDFKVGLAYIPAERLRILRTGIRRRHRLIQAEKVNRETRYSGLRG